MAHCDFDEEPPALGAALSSAQPLYWQLQTAAGCSIDHAMRFLGRLHVVAGRWRDCHTDSSGDFAALRSSLLRRLAELLAQPDSDPSPLLRHWMHVCRTRDANVQLLVDEVIALLLSHGADPFAADAPGSSLLFHLASANRHAELTRLLESQRPWNSRCVYSELFQRNSDGQTLRELITASQSRDPRRAANLTLLHEHEAFWTQLKPALIDTLTRQCGMANVAAVMCAEYIDGSSSAKQTTEDQSARMDDEQ